MDRAELQSLIASVRQEQGPCAKLSPSVVIEILESHLALLDKFERVVSCR